MPSLLIYKNIFFLDFILGQPPGRPRADRRQTPDPAHLHRLRHIGHRLRKAVRSEKGAQR